MNSFLLISPRRKFKLFVQLLILVAVTFAMAFNLLGNYLPIEFWEVVQLYLSAALILGVIRSFMVSSYRTRNKLAISDRDNFILGTDSLEKLVTVFVTFIGALVILDIAFQEFLTSISLVAVALVLIFRDHISNYLDSFRLMFSPDYRIGNYVKVGETARGTIINISFRATTIKTDDGNLLFIPNTRFIGSEVINYSKTKSRCLIIPFSLPNEAMHPLSSLEERLKEALLTSCGSLVSKEKIFLRVLTMKQWHTDCQLEVTLEHYTVKAEDIIVKVIYSEVLAHEAEHRSEITGIQAGRRVSGE